jgi:hypothetical protein
MWDGSVEPIAQAIHERWRSERIDAGEPAPSWEELDESRKESSRDQARDIPVKLRLVGCDIAPRHGQDAVAFTFTDHEVDSLAAAEHVRWMRERIADGWTAGPKDVARKMTPYLVSFELLPAGNSVGRDRVRGLRPPVMGDCLSNFSTRLICTCSPTERAP